MNRYIAIDSGKSHTKVASLNPEFLKDNSAQAYTTGLFKTACDEGATFEDDDPGKLTYITEYNGSTYKVGRSATRDAELDSSKKSFTHKLCTMLGIARECSDSDTDEVCAAIGIPVDSYLVVKERNDYRDYILPQNGEEIIRYRDLDGTIKEKHFIITKSLVYPETIGAIFTPGIDFSGPVGVIDFGHLNVNMTIYNGGEIEPLSRRTTTKGMNFLVSGLAQELSNEFQTNISKNIAGEAILHDRKLKFRNPDPKKEEKSAETINRFIKGYVKDVIEEIRTKAWSLDVIQLVIIGGGATMIKDYLMEAFGENTVIPNDPALANVTGFLKLMCGRSDTLKTKLP